MIAALFGATGKTGKYLVPALLDAGWSVRALGRDRTKLAALDQRCETASIDLDRPAALASLLDGVDRVVSLAHARFAGTILAALPDSCARVVLTGSVRAFTKLPDPAAEMVRDAVAIFQASGRAGVVLHPSMIFGAPEDRNVGRILAHLEAWPRMFPLIVPLPDGGRHFVQPVYYDDVVAGFVAAVINDDAPGEPIILAGPEPLTYADMVRACAAACGRQARILAIPGIAATTAVRGATALGWKLPVSEAELRRATEDKVFDITEMKTRLGVTPRPFADALRDIVARRRSALAEDGSSGHDGG
ncbi:MAG: NAD(P)H-binding protein [Alphaproteobacteria bacterium]|nr:NAD(P)H-binding protein [Alphaproteobacteria bacterium]